MGCVSCKMCSPEAVRIFVYDDVSGQAEGHATTILMLFFFCSNISFLEIFGLVFVCDKRARTPTFKYLIKMFQIGTEKPCIG